MYFLHYSGVVIILFKRVYKGLHFLPILLENQFFVFLLCLFLGFESDVFNQDFYHMRYHHY